MTGALVKLERPVAWGGPTAWKVTRHKDICVAFHWVNGEPAMVLYLYGGFVTLGYGKRAVYVLPLDAAHTIVKAGTRGLGVDGRALMEKATIAAELFGRGGDRHVVRQIGDAILNSIEELLRMPPEPEQLQKRDAPTGEATFKVGGETIFEGEV